MGQRKKAHKFFRWMRQSDLPQPVDETAETRRDSAARLPPPPPPISVLSAPHSQSLAPPSPPHSPPPPAPAIVCGARDRLAPPTGTNRTIVLRVKELSGAHRHCFTQQHLRHIYVPTPAVPAAPASCSAPSASTRPPQSSSATTASNSATTTATATDTDTKPGPNASASTPAADRVVHPWAAPVSRAAKPHYLTEQSAAPKLHTIRETAAPASTTKSGEKSVSCRLYDCIRPVVSTCGNSRRAASSEPAESQASLASGSVQQVQCAAASSGATQLSRKRFLLEVMDRSVDSIGSCSLDVDAESTDFSDTSGSFNLCTPSSGKDFTREFTSRIHERCQLVGKVATTTTIPQQRTTTTILDPQSGQIKTILTSATATAPCTATSVTIRGPDSTDDAFARYDAQSAKKPSYLNLACCVNGYSNLTTYDSKLRQHIQNRSREVSPIRPIIHTLQYKRTNGTNSEHLLVPTSVAVAAAAAMPIVNDPAQPHSLSAMELGRAAGGAVDCPEQLKHSKSSTTTPQKQQLLGSSESPKSFIQQRVERLYGPSALAAGFYSPKRQTNGAPTDGASILAERSMNSSNHHHQQPHHGNHNKTDYHHHHHNHNQHNHLNGGNNSLSNGTATNATAATENHPAAAAAIGGESQSLPVMRHLRPEFRAQLPLVSPKRQAPVAHKHQQPNGTSVYNNTSSTKATASALSTRTTAATITNGAASLSLRANDDVVDAVAAAAAAAVVVVAGDVDAAPTVAPSAALVTDGSSLAASRRNGSAAASNGSDEVDDIHTHIITTAQLSPVAGNMKITADSVALVAATANGVDEDAAAAAAAAAIAVPIPAAAATTHGTTNGHHRQQPQLPESAATVASATTAASAAQDGSYFLLVMNAERERLLALSATAEQYMESLAQDVDEEIVGHLRSGAGKARLLATQKIRQFEGLCHNNLNQAPGEKFRTTDEDLQGFWDMVMLQVDHVDSLFRDIELYRANNWQKLPAAACNPPPTGSRLTKRPMGRGGVAVAASAAASAAASKTNGAAADAAAKKSAVAAAAAQRREAQRKQLMEMKRRAKKQQQLQLEEEEVVVVGGGAEADGGAIANGAASSAKAQEESGVEIFVNNSQQTTSS